MARTAMGMGLILISFTFLGMAVFGIVALLARVVRLRPPQRERCDLEENTFIREEWDMVQRRRCLPTGCPRTIGSPPRPRKDVTCEICAALYLERHWRHLLDTRPARRRTRLPGPGIPTAAALGYARPASPLHQISVDPPATDRREKEPRRSRPWRRRAQVGLVTAAVLLLLGASLLILPAHLVLSCVLVAAGIGCLVRARVGRSG